MTDCHRDPRVQDTRSRIFDSLLELTLEQGYGKTRVREILERAEVARSTFYAHFSDKEDLLLGGFDLFRLQPVPVSEEESGEEGAAGRELPLPDLRRIFSHAGFNLDFYEALKRGGDLDLPLRRARRDLELGYEEVFEDLVARGYTLSGDPHLLAQFFSGALMAVLVDWLERGTPEPGDQVAGSFQSLVRRGARGS